MVGISSLAVALFAIAGTLASPRGTVTEKRGPQDFVLGRHNVVSRQSAPDYNQDYTTGGTVDYSPDGSSFSVTWDTEDDFVVGVGWTTGSTLPITFDGSFSVDSGTGLLSVYGWTTDPLIEYYIIEDNSDPPSFGTEVGTLTSDGSSYTIWENERIDEPSIEGTSTFYQYISVRSSTRTSGTVTVENHFAAWAAHGLDLGTFNYQVIAVEGFGDAVGSAEQTVSDSGTVVTTTTTSAGTGPTGTCSALYGQCGGIGWTGPTCCSTGTCQESNAYYSQCLE